MIAVRGFFYGIGLALIAFAVAADLLTLFLLLRRVKRGRGPSGIPGVSWVIYFLWIMVFRPLLSSPPWSPMVSLLNLRDLAAATLFHLACQCALPWAYAGWRRFRAERRGASG